ncbi:hydroxypyruvate isomerase [Sphingomonas populi]|uniref:Hydroxypyruvate isomerase n=1 Tax=Sphingomonas populi TaxID=2484750 RepID=A0A4Q6XSH9_9SPHN|nr:TIM barrel protein [Sphingomonas populi]RZF59236.1 hydroxypyruvate isomerase [Sphingomonas populi]
MTLSPAACIEWLFPQSGPDLSDRVVAAKKAGFNAVEFHLWRDKPMSRIAQALTDHGVRVSSFCVDPRRSMIDPAEHDELVQAVRDSIEAGKALGSPPMIVASGFNVPGMTHEEQHANAIVGLRRIADVAEEAGVILLLEPLNNRVELPLIYLSSTSQALDLIETVDSPNLRLLYDMYHSAVMEESVPGVLEGRMHLVHHVQVADTKGRHEPGTGDIDWDAAISELVRMGYDGAIGFEYLPTLPDDESTSTAKARIGL